MLLKGPVRTKNSTESKFTTAREKRYGNSKTLRIVLRSASFSRKKRQENGTDTEKLRRQQNTADLSAVLFLVRKGFWVRDCERGYAGWGGGKSMVDLFPERLLSMHKA